MSDQSRSTDASREALSALVDGQARPDELSQILQAWKGDAVPGGGMPQAHAERRGSAKPPCSPTGVKSPAKKKKQGPSHE